MKHHHDKARKTAALLESCSVSIEQAMKTAQSTVGGTLFDVKLKEVDGRPVWRIKLLLSDRRVKINIDAQSGRILDAKAEVEASESSELTLREPVLAGSTAIGQAAVT